MESLGTWVPGYLGILYLYSVPTAVSRIISPIISLILTPEINTIPNPQSEPLVLRPSVSLDPQSSMGLPNLPNPLPTVHCPHGFTDLVTPVIYPEYSTARPHDQGTPASRDF